MNTLITVAQIEALKNTDRWPDMAWWFARPRTVEEMCWHVPYWALYAHLHGAIVLTASTLDGLASSGFLLDDLRKEVLP